MNLETFLKIGTLSFLPTTRNHLNMPMKIKRKHMVGNPPKEQPIPLTFIATPTPWATFCPQDSSSSKKAYPFISSTFSNTLLRQQTSTNTRYQLLEGEEKLNVVLKHVSTFPTSTPQPVISSINTLSPKTQCCFPQLPVTYYLKYFNARLPQCQVYCYW